VDGDLSRIDAGDIASAGTSTRVPHADHQHPVNTEGGATLSTIQAGDTADGGVATTVPRGDHQHPVATAVVGDIAAVGTVAQAGAGATIPRGDHVHPGVDLATAQTVGGAKTFSAKATFQAEVEVNGDFKHAGLNIGLHGATPVLRNTGWTISNVTTRKTYDANATTLDEIADCLGTLIEHVFKLRGDLGA
jgi:hypothetical protein